MFISVSDIFWMKVAFNMTRIQSQSIFYCSMHPTYFPVKFTIYWVWESWKKAHLLLNWGFRLSSFLNFLSKSVWPNESTCVLLRKMSENCCAFDFLGKNVLLLGKTMFFSSVEDRNIDESTCRHSRLQSFSSDYRWL